MNKIAWVHIDILDKINDFEKGLYPRSHLWGYPLENNNGFHALNPFSKNKWLHALSKFHECITRARFGNLLIEISLLLKIKEYNSIYCISGKLFWIPILKKFGLIRTKLIILIYRIPEPVPFWKFHNLHLSAFILSAYDGVNCLTKKTENDLVSLLGNHKEIEYIPWCTDDRLFVNKGESEPIYFFSSGKTNRDYTTLLDSIQQLSEKKFLLIGHFPKTKIVNEIPNLIIIHSDKNQTDTAIPYRSLVKHYSEAIAVCISLNGDPNDTCGYTEMLEAMAMGKPVLMTRSGCLDINIEKENIGFYVNSHDPSDWVKKINFISNNPKETKFMGKNGRRLVEQIYNISSYEKRVQDFLDKISSKSFNN